MFLKQVFHKSNKKDTYYQDGWLGESNTTKAHTINPFKGGQVKLGPNFPESQPDKSQNHLGPKSNWRSLVRHLHEYCDH